MTLGLTPTAAASTTRNSTSSGGYREYRPYWSRFSQPDPYDGSYDLTNPPPRIRHPRTGFERLPRDLSRAELFRYFTFSAADLEQIRLCRGETNRLGFALLLGGVRLSGRFLYDLDLLSPNLIAHVSRQFQINPPGALYYPQRRPTRYEHVTRLKAYLGLRSFASEDSALAAEHARERIRSGTRAHTLLTSCEQSLREQRGTLPSRAGLGPAACQ